MPKNSNDSVIRISSALIVVLALGIFGYATISAQYETKKASAMEDLRILKYSVEGYKLKFSQTPLNILSLESSAITKKIPIDPWGNNYRLVSESTQETSTYAVYSSGANGNYGTVSFTNGILGTTDKDDIGFTNAILPKGNNNWL